MEVELDLNLLDRDPYLKKQVKEETRKEDKKLSYKTPKIIILPHCTAMNSDISTIW